MEDINNVEEIKDIEMLYDKCENMEQLYERYYLPLQQELDRVNEKLKKIEKYIEVSKEQITTKYSNEIPKEILLTHINIILNKIKGDD